MTTPLPADILPSIVFTSGQITINAADLPRMLAADWDPTTGDGRKMIMAFVEVFHDWYQSLDTASRPSQFSSTEANPVGQATNEVRKSFTFSFDLDVSDSGLADEPI